MGFDGCLAVKSETHRVVTSRAYSRAKIFLVRAYERFEPGSSHHHARSVIMLCSV
jgi:hypothetical protein